jgi:hypothetical protein
MLSTRLPRRLAALGFLLLTATLAHACSTPVFRVALLDPKWRPERYELTLFHKGPLADADKAILQGLNDYLDKNDGHINCTLEVVDLDNKPPAALRELWRKQGAEAKLPYLVVRHPESQDVAPNLWAGPLDKAPLRALLESPARAEVARRILAGDSAVFVFLESGDKAADDAAFKLLETQLAKLAKTLQLPELKPGDEGKYQSETAPPLKLAFSTLRLARTDTAEKWFIEMLLLTEEDLKARQEPMVFPIYGRGIALYALIGKGITDKNIAAAAMFVVGECACEVRRENPGKDLLIAAAWETGQPLPEVSNLLYMPAKQIVCDLPGDSPTPWYQDGDILLPVGGGLALGLIAIFAYGWYVQAGGKG